MMTVYLSPYRRLASLREAMDRMLEEGVENEPREREMTLAVDVRANEEAFIIRALVPGLDADDLDIEILNNTVTLRGEFVCADDEGVKYLACELPVGRFSRSITLPVDVEPAKAEASMKDGVLTLRIPKAEAHRPKTIKVAVN